MSQAAPAHAGLPRPSPHAGLARMDWQALGLWRAHTLGQACAPSCPSGHPRLDAELPGGGWPLAGLTEILTLPGSGEMQLLAPALARPRSAAEAGQGAPPEALLWIAPPCLPYAPALLRLGLPLKHLSWIQPATEADGAWAAEQALRAARCAWVLWWPKTATPEMLRRLHLAAQEGHTPLLALRPLAARGQSSPAPLRLACQALPGRGLAVDVFKRRGPALATPVHLDLPHPVPGAQPGRPSQPGKPRAVPDLPRLPGALPPPVTRRPLTPFAPAALPPRGEPAPASHAVAVRSSAARAA